MVDKSCFSPRSHEVHEDALAFGTAESDMTALKTVMD
jgi:hypothetical protein